MSQCDGRAQLLRVDLVGGDGELAGVVEQVVEQDLDGQHRQEAAGTADAPAALNMLPKLLRRAHQHVLDRVGEDAPALGDAVGEHAEVLLQQDDVGGVLGDVGGGVDGDADVGGVQGERVVDAVAEEADGPAAAPAQRRTMPRLLLRADPGEDRRRPRRRRRARRRPAPSMSAPVSVPPTGRPRSRADLLGDARVVAGDDLDRDAELGQPSQGRRPRRPWAGRGRPASPASVRSRSSAGVERRQRRRPARRRPRRPGCRRRTARSQRCLQRRPGTSRAAARARPPARPW